MESAEQPTKDLQKKVKGFLNQAGHPVTAEDVNPSIDSRFENIGDFLGKTTGHSINEAGAALGGVEPSFPMETAPGHRAISSWKDRVMRKLHLEKAA